MISNYDPDDFDPIKTINKIFRILLIICVSIVIFGASQCHAQTKNDYINLIRGHGIKYPEVTFKQMMLESGNLNCKNCAWSKYNNAFGFHNGKRFLKYDNLEHCLQGFKEWQRWRCPDCKTKENYYNCLIKYWGAPNMPQYIEKLKKM